MKGKRKPPHIKQANYENRKKRREQKCENCYEHPCKCDSYDQRRDEDL